MLNLIFIGSTIVFFYLKMLNNEVFDEGPKWQDYIKRNYASELSKLKSRYIIFCIVFFFFLNFYTISFKPLDGGRVEMTESKGFGFIKEKRNLKFSGEDWFFENGRTLYEFYDDMERSIYEDREDY